MASLSPTEHPWVRVVIVNYNGGAFLQRCVDALAAQTFAGFEAVIVDNASQDGSADALTFPDRRFRLVRSATNLGFSGGSNLGASDAQTDWLAMLNPDTIAAPDWLEQLHPATLRNPSTCLFGSKQIMADSPELIDGFGDVYSIFGIPWRGGYGWPVESCPTSDCLVFAPCAAAALYRRALFVRLGGFDEDFFCYLEDIDFGFRAKLEGFDCIQVARATVRHHGSALTGKRSHFTLFHSCRNRVWLLLKNVPAALLPIMIPGFILAMIWLFVRTRKMQPWVSQWQGFWESRNGILAILKKRATIQRGRVLPVHRLARQLVWNHRAVRRRDYCCRPISRM